MKILVSGDAEAVGEMLAKLLEAMVKEDDKPVTGNARKIDEKLNRTGNFEASINMM